MNTRWFAFASIGLMLALSAITYGQLPENVAIHWNMQGEIDGYGSKGVAVLIFPVVAIFISLLMRVLPAHDPISKNPLNAELTRRFGDWVVVFLLVVHIGILGNALGLPFNIIQLITGATGVLLIAIGNEMGRLKPNSWAGIRLPWTLADEEVWRKSNRMGGRSFVLVGLACIVSALALPPPAGLIVLTTATLIAVIFMTVYSYWVAQQKRRSLNR